MRHTAVLALTALAASGCGVGVHFADFRYRFTPADTHVTGPVSVIEVQASGHVNVTPGGGGVTIHRVVHYQKRRPQLGQQLSGGVLTFTDRCRQCSVDYDLTVPSSVEVRASTNSSKITVAGVAKVDAHSDSGSVEVRQVHGDVNASTNSGSATVEHVTGSVDGHTDSGRVAVADIAGPLSLATHSGAIDGSDLRSAATHASTDSGQLGLGYLARPSLVDARTDSGAIVVAVPGGPYQVSATTDSGGKDISVPTASDVPARISVRSDSGHLTVQPN